MGNKNEKSEFENFENAPIILSILQFRYKRIERFDAQAIKKKGIQLANDYPERKDRVVQKIHFNPPGAENSTNVSFDERRIDGLQFISKDKKRILVIGEERFTYEMHGRYLGWTEFRNEAKRLWELFQEDMHGIQLTGLSLRYVNRINIPIETSDTSKYFTTFIESVNSDQKAGSFQMKYTSNEPDDNLTIHVGHVLEPPIGDQFPYLFDIDAIHLSELNNDPTIIWDIFETLRRRKNTIFLEGITEETKKIIR